MRHLSFKGQFGDLQTSRSQGVELTSHSGRGSFLASGIFVLRMAENLVRLGKGHPSGERGQGAQSWYFWEDASECLGGTSSICTSSKCDKARNKNGPVCDCL